MKYYTQIALTWMTTVLASVAAAAVVGVYARILVGAFCLGYGCK